MERSEILKAAQGDTAARPPAARPRASGVCLAKMLSGTNAFEISDIQEDGEDEN
jgi:hypothetical protein